MLASTPNPDKGSPIPQLDGQASMTTTQSDSPFSILDSDGRIQSDVDKTVIPVVSDDEALRLYRGMLEVRLVDDRMMKLQRTGRLGFYMLSLGEEATHYGGAFPLRDTDWVFPCYREPGLAFWRGYTIQEYVNQLFGNAEDLVKGRQMPVHHAVRRINYVSISSPVGTQIPQAMGMGWAAKVAKKDDVAIVYFGEGATSTGEFHVGLNFAGVFKTNTIFFCRNNGWAISTGADKQSASANFAMKALAYGVRAVRVDGNDLLAVIAVVADAAKRARAGEGATLIEAVTYRRGGHSSSDDPSVYRDPADVTAWEAHDPIEMWRKHLVVRGLWNEALHQQMTTAINDEIAAALKHAEAVGAPAVDTLFDDVFATDTPALAEQRAECLALPRQKPFHGGQ